MRPMTIREVTLDDRVLEVLIRLSKDWEEENSCCGYRANERTDIEGNRIFLAEEAGEVIGYLFGKHGVSENMRSVMPNGTAVFEVEELYVIPSRRSMGVGKRLFETMEKTVRNEAEYAVLSTATKNWKAILHFYIDEVEMTFWSARLYKRIGGEPVVKGGREE